MKRVFVPPGAYESPPGVSAWNEVGEGIAFGVEEGSNDRRVCVLGSEDEDSRVFGRIYEVSEEAMEGIRAYFADHRAEERGILAVPQNVVVFAFVFVLRIPEKIAAIRKRRFVPGE